MKILRSFALILSMVIFFSCNSDKAPQKKAVVNSNEIELPGVPAEQMIELWNNCEFVDYIFHDLPFSLNQSEKAAIQANINFIGTDPVGKVNLDCKPIGREFFQINGEIALEADVYYSPNCYFYVFVKDEKPTYANKISDAGMNFYKQITTQVKVGE